MTRIRRRLAFPLLALVIGQLVVLAQPALACACGAVLTHGGDEPVKVADETSLVRYQHGREDIVMSLGLTGSPTNAAWFLPVPAKPSFGLADQELFSELATITAPQVVSPPRDNDCNGQCAVPGAERPSPDVSVIQRVPVGPYDVATLAASDGDALHDWLDAHGFSLSADLARGVTPYAKQHWMYVAVRLNPASGQQTLGRQLPPLQVTFDSPELVYPMRLTALATRDQTVRLYLLADHRMRAVSDAGPSSRDVAYAGWIEPVSVRHRPLGKLVDHRMFLTRFDQVDLAPSQVTDDYHFRRAASDQTYRRVIHQGAPTPTTIPASSAPHRRWPWGWLWAWVSRCWPDSAPPPSSCCIGADGPGSGQPPQAAALLGSAAAAVTDAGVTALAFATESCAIRS